MDSTQVLAQIAGASVRGIPLIFVVLGLVQYFKRLGAKGNSLLIVSMAIGLLLGAGYQAYVLAGTPGPGVANAGAWYTALFGAVLFGLLLGLVASGIYDVADGIVTTAVARLNGERPPGWTGSTTAGTATGRPLPRAPAHDPRVR